MKKRKLSGEVVVLGIFFFSIGFLIFFGNDIRFTGHAVSEGDFEGDIFEGNIEIQVENTYKPGENVNFRINIYEEDKRINDKVSFEIQNFYGEIIEDGIVDSGESVSYRLLESADKGYWGIISKYRGVEKKELFNVLEFEKAEIILEEDKLIIINVGNVPYTKSVQISIGDHEETALVPLGIGERKEIKLTAPFGEYDIRVNDGSYGDDIVFKSVSLTGNVVGLERISNEGFFKKFPLISLFVIVIFVLIVTSVLKFRRGSFGLNENKKGKLIVNGK